MKRTVKLSEVKIDKSVQPRLKINPEKIEEYAEAMKEGATFPPLMVVETEDSLILWDGFHRFQAAKKSKQEDISVDITKGTVRDAILLSFGANSEHGIPRSNEDRRRAVSIMAKDPEWSTWSQNDIAKACHVSPAYVSLLLKELKKIGVHKPSVRKATRGGKEYEIDTSGITGKPKEKEDPPENIRPEDAPPPEESKDYTEMVFSGCSNEEKLTYFRVFGVLSNVLNYVGSLNIPEVSGRAIMLMEKCEESLQLPWAKSIPPEDRKAESSPIKKIEQWIEKGISFLAPKAKAAKKEVELCSAEALECLDIWKKSIGLPDKAKKDAVYAACFDRLSRRGHSWDTVKELIKAIKIEWVDKGIVVMSPQSLLGNTKSGDPRDELLLKQYRQGHGHVPVGPVPVCPECTAPLEKQKFKKDGDVFIGYLCNQHPKASVEVGEAYSPRKRFEHPKKK